MSTTSTTTSSNDNNNNYNDYNRKRRSNALDALNNLPTTGTIKHYYGIYIGYAVKIVDQQQSLDLYNRGCFGKGILSRSNPSYNNNNGVGGGTSSGFHIKTVRNREQTTDEVEPPLKVQRNDDCEDNTTVSSSLSYTQSQSQSQTTMIEYLQLSLYEAFYLLYALGCLTILRHPIGTEEVNVAKDRKRKVMVEMSIDECWNRFNMEDNKFLEHYIAYHHFRSTGWIPRSGLKYGCDFVLYKKRPELVHAQYQVIVQFDDNNANNNSDDDDDNDISWEYLSRMNRVSESVAKGTIICRVKSRGDGDDNIESGSGSSSSSTSTLSSSVLTDLESNRYCINVWTTKRWTPSRTRS
ncbi:hypothetical protein SAMD00019534_064480 [Acytostelium subglobosum LB1]|uniref:hypothetical protein n=1 Tax=Acytostelium subglobosum LB1 TaxID=1410327 RepID=UPI000644B736|nr:hypothetical protein SAMD00019534_064480 [Acytostelium subglobosum LB1]GAM23273.1 hypothetical protein SAMD00019534_064480 [Acytostelium subglobosum LB1]|eukprot:XP_012753722.1 hypothetical protein SAMD00019534_064480 [Acytostelium subglobosum LB1]